MLKEAALIKLKLFWASPTGTENRHHSEIVWGKRENADLQKLLAVVLQQRRCPHFGSYAENGYSLTQVAYWHAQIGCTVPNRAKTCLHKPTRAKFYPFTESEKELLGKIREDMVDGPSIVFARKVVVDETFLSSPQSFVNQLLGLTPANFTSFLCVDPYRQYFILDMNSTKVWKNSKTNKTTQQVFKKWHVLFSTNQTRV